MTHSPIWGASSNSATSTTVTELQGKLQESITNDKPNVPASKTTTLTFKPHEDQHETIMMAIEKAKAESKTTVNTVALEYICIDFMAGPSKVSK